MISPIAFSAVQKFDAIFALERGINGLSPEQRLAARRRDIAPLVNEFIAWMKKELLPRSDGRYAIGAENFAKQLLYEELVDIPLDKLLGIGEATLRRDQKAVLNHPQRLNLCHNFPRADF